MNHFPQLTTGSVAQYPLLSQRTLRSVRNESMDGHQVKLADPNSESLTWELRLSALTTAEWQAIESLFVECEGGLDVFTFLDPFDNLLARSEDFTETVWQKGALVQLTGSISDPLGTERATRILNASQSAQTVAQTLPVSAGFHYCLSLFARSDQSAPVKLQMSSASATLNKTVATSPAWQRFFCSGNLAAPEEAVDFGIEIESGATVDIFGLQVDAQPGPSDYKKTTADGGVYPKARFAEDMLRVTSESPDQHSLTVRILSALKD